VTGPEEVAFLKQYLAQLERLARRFKRVAIISLVNPAMWAYVPGRLDRHRDLLATARKHLEAAERSHSDASREKELAGYREAVYRLDAAFFKPAASS
jgi:hypothetical protein